MDEQDDGRVIQISGTIEGTSEDGQSTEQDKSSNQKG